MNTEKYFPIGTVVLLKNATKKIMITGFCIKDKNTGTVYDYCGCIYPYGIISSEQNLVFNHNQIANVYFIGYVNNDEKNFKEELNKKNN